MARMSKVLAVERTCGPLLLLIVKDILPKRAATTRVWQHFGDPVKSSF